MVEPQPTWSAIKFSPSKIDFRAKIIKLSLFSSLELFVAWLLGLRSQLKVMVLATSDKSASRQVDHPPRNMVKCSVEITALN